MRKEEYLQRLEKLLYNIPAEDREEALQFYRDYLEDAGEAVDEVLTALGTPEELAQSIRKDLYGDNEDGDFTRTSKDLPGTYRVPFSKGGKFLYTVPAFSRVPRSLASSDTVTNSYSCFSSASTMSRAASTEAVVISCRRMISPSVTCSRTFFSMMDSLWISQSWGSTDQ